MIAIDAGHGGHDRGCTANGLVEKDLTLRLSRILGDCLAASKLGFALTRKSDEAMSLSDRGDKARAMGTTQVSIIHFDSNADEHVGRTTFYVRPNDSQASDIAANIGRCIPPVLTDRTLVIETSPDDWRRRANNVLRAHEATPALLIECAFLSKSHHAAFLRAPQGLATLATAIACGLNTNDTKLWKDPCSKLHQHLH